jgi:hypothetical protein
MSIVSFKRGRAAAFLSLVVLNGAFIQGCGDDEDGVDMDTAGEGGEGNGTSGSAGKGGKASGGSNAGKGGSSTGDAGEGMGGDGGTAGNGGTAGTGGNGGAAGTAAGSGGTGGNGGTTGGGAAGNGGSAGTSGTAGNGGTAGTAGNGGTSGTAGNGGSAGAGGTAGTAGAGGTAGTAGAGGTAGTAGSAGNGGTAGEGGTAGTAGTGGSAGTSGGGTGGVAAVCDNDVVEEGEDCDPPFGENCGEDCKDISTDACQACAAVGCAGAETCVGTPSPALCNETLDCVRDSGCAEGGFALFCYCGAVSSTECDTPGGAAGACKEVIEAGLGNVDPIFIQNNFFDIGLSAGRAMARVDCELGAGCGEGVCF